MNERYCNFCGSIHLRKVSVVYEEQSSSGGFNGAFAGAGISAGGLGVGAGMIGGKTSNRSLLAARLSPPFVVTPPSSTEKPIDPGENIFPKKSLITTILCIIGLILAFQAENWFSESDTFLETFRYSAGVSSFFVGIGSGFYFLCNLGKKEKYWRAISDYNRKLEEYKQYYKLKQEYDNLWICMDCGECSAVELDNNSVDGRI